MEVSEMKKIADLRSAKEQRPFAVTVYDARALLAVALLCIVTSIASAQVTYQDLVNFDGTNGQNPTDVTLVQGLDGNLYGTTHFGGTSGTDQGTVFKISPSGTLTTLYNFCQDTNCPDGDQPMTGLTLVIGGDFYGTTFGGGAHNSGTVFKITPAGKLTTIYSFCSLSGCADGLNPSVGTSLIQGTDGNLYGATSAGGVNGGGSIFKITPTGTLTTLYSWPSFVAQYPTGLVQGSNGNFYLTVSGGVGQPGFIAEITPAGKEITLYTFCSLKNCLDGSNPGGPLVQGANGDLYGTTAGGGEYGNGTFFELTLGGTLTSLHSFDYETAGNLGSAENSGVILGADGNFYGVGQAGGEDCTTGCGTLFQITPAGVLTTLYEFTGGNTSWAPWGLAQDTSGAFFGTTANGGPDSEGTVYTVADGLAPFVKLVTNYGLEGKTIDILGQGFTSSSVVKFGGVPATSVTPDGSTALIATVPAGALTGSVTVTTGGTKLTSNQIFKVTPQILSFSPTSGPVGTPVTIMGTGLTQTLGVGFGDYVPAKNLNVVSDMEVTVTVPSGAKTGPVGAETKGGIGISKQIFTVTQ
jgi:uncharacterized repeat protein (TIGR03803 family)